MQNHKPTVLCFSGHDPSGGAGIQADIETLSSHQCHSYSVITALTEQNTHNVQQLIPQKADDIVSQARRLLDDIDINAFKIGLIGHHEIAQAIHSILQDYAHIPVILDPVLAAGGGSSLSNAELIAAMGELLLPQTTILTPNGKEARLLSGHIDDLESCALSLLNQGCDYVLITGADEQTPSVSNRLYAEQKLLEHYTWDRLPHMYHGSGCTLASSIAAMLAHGLPVSSAVLEAQEYTWNALQQGFQPGSGQYLPNRFFWMQQQDS